MQTGAKNAATLIKRLFLNVSFYWNLLELFLFEHTSSLYETLNVWFTFSHNEFVSFDTTNLGRELM